MLQLCQSLISQAVPSHAESPHLVLHSICPHTLLYFLSISLSHVHRHTVRSHIHELGAADICATIILAHWVDSQLHAGVALHCHIKNSNSGQTEGVTLER